MSIIRGLWSLLTPLEKRDALLLQLLAVSMAASTLGGIAALAPFLMVFTDPGLIDRTPWLAALHAAAGFDGRRAFLIALGVAFVSIVSVTNAINLAGSLAMTRFALRVGDRLHVGLFGEYLRRDYLFHVRHGSTKLASNAIYGVNRITSGIIESTLMLATSLLVIAFIFASILWVSPAVAVISAGWMGAAYLLYFLLFRRRLLRAGQLEGTRMVTRARITHEGLTAIKEVQVQRHERFFVDEFAHACADISRTAMGLQAITLAPRHLLEVVTVTGLVGSVLAFGSEGGGGHLMAGLALLGFGAYRLLPAIQQVFACSVRLRTSRPIFEALAPDLSVQAAPAGGAAAPPACERPRKSIALEQVEFRYDSGRDPALRDVNMEFRVGGMAGIVGANGSGKTTLIDIVAGLLRPDSGRLLVDGIAIHAGNLQAWQAHLAYVPQQVFLLDGSIAANIALGVPPAHIDRERLDRAMRGARVDEFAAKLPHGIDEQVGERGLALSGGQRQRIAIARALYRESPVLLMDEPTSALDGFTEQELVEVLAALRGHCTIILVAHRAATIRLCDAVFELHEGVVARRDAQWPVREGACT